MEKQVKLSDRKEKLLINAVENYIETALPITSQKVHSQLFKELSSATLRNELSALEEMGYLRQLHTSGGRVPTTMAYRYYVNNLMVNSELDEKNLNIIKNKFINRSAFLVEVLDDLAKSINEITNYPTFVHVKGFNDLTILGVNIIPLITGQALLLIQTDAGIINNTISLRPSIQEEHCKDASKFLSTNLCNKKIGDIIENFDSYNKAYKTQIMFYQELFITLTDFLKQYTKDSRFIKSANKATLLDMPEHKDVESAKKFINIIENEKEIKEIISNIDNSSNSDIVFSIGEENKNENLNNYSIIKANYTLGEGIVTSIGVVGPERMDYAKIASALKYITDEINLINRSDKDGKK